MHLHTHTHTQVLAVEVTRMLLPEDLERDEGGCGSNSGGSALEHGESPAGLNADGIGKCVPHAIGSSNPRKRSAVDGAHTFLGKALRKLKGKSLGFGLSSGRGLCRRRGG